MLMDLRSQQVHLYLAQIIGDDVEEELAEFQNTYYAFSAKPEVSEFLFAEGRFTRLFNEVQKVLGKKLDLWTDMEVRVPNNNIFLN